MTLTPRNMFRDESKPAAYTRATRGFERSQRMRHANRDIVLCSTLFSPVLSPGIVSITTKSMGDSDDRPICNDEHKKITQVSNGVKVACTKTHKFGVLGQHGTL